MSAARTMTILRRGASFHHFSLAKRTFAAASSNEPLVKTALYDLHKDLGGDMVPFAGYELPVLYKGENGGVMKEHLWCRSDGKASLFDVSHMGQVTKTIVCSNAKRPMPSHSHQSLYHSHLISLFRFAGMEKIALNFWKRSSWVILLALLQVLVAFHS